MHISKRAALVLRRLAGIRGRGVFFGTLALLCCFLLIAGEMVLAIESSLAVAEKSHPLLLLGKMLLGILVAGSLACLVSSRTRKKAELELVAIFENSLAGMLFFSNDRIIVRANRKAEQIFGWEPGKLCGRSSRVLHVDEKRYQEFGMLSKRMQAEDLQFKWPYRKYDGTIIWCEVSGRALDPRDLSKGVVMVYDDVTERQRDLERLRESERMNGILLRVSNAMQRTETLEDFFKQVHDILKESLDAVNFFAALVDKEHDRIVFPYFSDQHDKMYFIDNISDLSKETLTLHVIRSGERLVLRREELALLRSQKRFTAVGNPAAVWVGIPLTLQGQVIGAMAVQDYENPDCFGEAEVRLLEAVADQIAMALRRKQDGDALLQSETRFRSLFENMRDGIVCLDLDGSIQECNRAFRSLLGYSDEELGSMSDQDITPPEWHEHEAEIMEQQVLRNGYSEVYEKEYVTSRGSFIPVELRAHLSPGVGGSRSEVWTMVRDVTDRKRMEDELRRQALHDPLTGLANRTLCLDRLRQCMGRSRRRRNYYYAVIFVDLDRFKAVNDSLGHAYGDKLLVGVAQRLTDCVRELDTVARYGGDEFVVILEELDSPRKAIQVVKRMRSEIRQPFDLDDKEAQTTISVGVVLGPMTKGTPEEILQNSNIALHRAKEKGRDRFKVFTDRMLEQTVHLLTLENDLVAGLGTGQFSIHFQPIMNLQNGTGLYGFEALARWNHPDRGAIQPEEFIAVAEEAGSIHDLGLWVLHEACSIMARWRKKHPEAEHLILAVNVSGRQFSNMYLVSRVRGILEKTGYPANRLKLEITETAIMDNAVLAADMLRQLKELGVKLSIDDFGTGYSSMSYLQRLPVDNLKIDLSFVRRMDSTPGDVEIVRAIISLAHSLGMGVVAEGVESAEHRDILTAMGCEYGQGYHFSRPLPEDQACLLICGDDDPLKQ